jgi:hypothetical protein
MPRRGRLDTQVSAWAIRSVSLRKRDGPARLDQAYRRLLADGPASDPPRTADRSPPPPRHPSRGADHDSHRR